MSHPFGDLISQYLRRKPGLTQARLAAGIDQSASIIALMCRGQRLTGGQARERVLAIIRWMQQEGILLSVAEANMLLNAAGMAGLDEQKAAEAILMRALTPAQPASSVTGREEPLRRSAVNLVLPATSFIGRMDERTEVIRLLAGGAPSGQANPPTTRLVTLTGAGGSGKTRLAVEIGRELQPHFPDGVWMVELARIEGAGDVMQAVASIFRLQERRNQSLVDIIVNYLAEKQLLLIMDNCEHVINACAELATTLLRRCSHLSIIATSREELQIGYERVFPVAPLAVPDLPAPPSTEMVSEYAAVRLFVERAQMALPAFVLTEANAPIVAEVCRRLDGIPLAIELAAARMQVLTVEQLVANLDDRFRILSGGRRTALPRQQTMWAAIDWSFRLLDEAEQIVFRRLGVFTGSFSLEAAECVCAADDHEPEDILDLLSRLAGKSLVVVEWGDPGTQLCTTRYHMLETIREYAAARLAGSGEVGSIRRRHLDWYLDFANAIQSNVRERLIEQKQWIAAIEEEYANIRAALAWSEQGGVEAIEQGLRLALVLGSYWMLHGFYSDIAAWFVRMLQHNIQDQTLRALSLLEAGTLMERLGKFTEAQEYIEACLAIAEKHDDKRTMSNALGCLALLTSRHGDFTRPVALYRKSLDLAREAGDLDSIAGALGALAAVLAARGEIRQGRQLIKEALAIWRQLGIQQNIAASLKGLWSLEYMHGDPERASGYLHECLAICREIGYKAGIGSALNNLGETARFRGDFALARRYYEECLAIYGESGDQLATTSMLINLGDVELHEGNLQQSAALYLEGLRNGQELGMKQYISMCLVGFGGIAAAMKQPVLAVQLLAAAKALYETLGIVLPSTDRRMFERNLAAARFQMDEEGFMTAWAAGLAMETQEAIATAQKFGALVEASLPTE